MISQIQSISYLRDLVFSAFSGNIQLKYFNSFTTGNTRLHDTNVRKKLITWLPWRWGPINFIEILIRLQIEFRSGIQFSLMLILSTCGHLDLEMQTSNDAIVRYVVVWYVIVRDANIQYATVLEPLALPQ